MTEEPDLRALVREWKALDMTPTQLALDTGKLRTVSSRRLIASAVISVSLAAAWLHWMFFAEVSSVPVWLGGMVCWGALTLGTLRFFWRQRRAVDGADVLLTGSPAALVWGRRALLETELYAWTGREARVSERWLAPGCVLVLILLAHGGTVSWIVPVVTVLLFVGFSGYGRVFRVPALCAEMEELEALARSLET